MISPIPQWFVYYTSLTFIGIPSIRPASATTAVNHSAAEREMTKVRRCLKVLT